MLSRKYTTRTSGNTSTIAGEPLVMGIDTESSFAAVRAR